MKSVVLLLPFALLSLSSFHISSSSPSVVLAAAPPSIPPPISDLPSLSQLDFPDLIAASSPPLPNLNIPDVATSPDSPLSDLKIPNAVAAASAAASSAVSGISSVGCPFSPSAPIIQIPQHIHYVDHVPSTSVYLFRGGSPDYNPPSQPDQVLMDYSGFYQGILNAALDPHEHAPILALNSTTPFYIIDINLLNFKDPWDIQNTIAEYSYFNANPLQGEMVFFENVGIKDDANNPVFFESDTVSKEVLTEFRNYIYSNGANMRNNDHLERQMDLIRKTMEDKDAVGKVNAKRAKKREELLAKGKTLSEWEMKDVQNIVIYFHCDCGCDRTGEVAGAYYMKYLGWSWEDTIKKNTAVIEARSMTCMNYRSLQWYCLYLNSIMGLQNNCLNNFIPCSPDDC